MDCMRSALPLSWIYSGSIRPMWSNTALSDASTAKLVIPTVTTSARTPAALSRDILLRKSEKKHYAGILQHRYDCSAIVDGVEKEFILVYHPGDNSWHMVLPD